MSANSCSSCVLTTPTLEFDFKSRTLTADGWVFGGVDGLFFDDSVYTHGGVADYSERRAVLYVAEKVYISVEEERLDAGYARVAVVRRAERAERGAEPKAAWVPGKLISRLLWWLRRRVYYEVDRVHYDAATRTASFRPAGMPPIKVTGINELLFRPMLIGAGTIIQPEVAVVAPGPKDFLIVEVSGDVLIIDYGSYG